ncbi:MAG: hypothetical protein AABZ55_15300 [Bdellovibrionota bacterium]
MKGNQNKWCLRSAALVLSSVCLIGIESCSSAQITVMCKERLPAFKVELDSAVAGLSGPGQPSQGGDRAIATVRIEPSQKAQLDESERNLWTKWSHAKLKQTQDYLDLVEDEPKNRPLRREIGQIANDFVVLHGLALAGKRQPMLKKISDITEQIEKISQSNCSL